MKRYFFIVILFILASSCKTENILKNQAYRDYQETIEIPNLKIINDNINRVESINNVYVKGNYIVTVGSIIRIFDVSKPEKPKPVSELTDGLYEIDKNEICIKDDYIYATDRYSNLYIIDISDPSNPYIVSKQKISGEESSISVYKNYALVSYREETKNKNILSIIDISNPVMPIIKKEIELIETPRYIYINKNYAYLLEDTKLQIIDISQIENPKISSTIDILKHKAAPAYLADITVKDNYAYICTHNDELQIVDISNPKAPYIKKTLKSLGATSNIKINGQYAYITCYDAGIKVIDISVPDKPVIITEYRKPIYARGIDIDKDYVYVTYALGNGLQIINFKDITSPHTEGTIKMSGYTYDVAIGTNYAFTANGPTGMDIIDISDPYKANKISSIELPEYGDAVGVAVKDKYAYIADQFNGLLVIDISKPKTPKMVNSIRILGYAKKVKLAKNYAYVAADTGGLQIIDISNPESPFIAGAVHPPGRATDIEIQDNFAYIADGPRLEIVDITNPSSPSIVGTKNFGSDITGIRIDGSYAYIASNKIIFVTDISHPSSPSVISTFDFVKSAYNKPIYDIIVINNLAYVDYGNKIAIIDVSNPQKPNLAKDFAFSSFTVNAFAAKNNYLYIAGGSEGLIIIKIN